MDYSSFKTYLPVFFVIVQFVGFIFLYVNTYNMASDKNAQSYYSANIVASVLLSIPLGLLLLLDFLNFKF